MRHVLSNSSEVAHRFANQNPTPFNNVGTDYARSSNTSFDGHRFYSYNTVIGTFIKNDKGEIAILLNDWNYSVTTAKHQSELRMATRQYEQIFTSQSDVAQVRSSISELLSKWQVAKSKKLDYQSSANYLFKKLNEWYIWNNSKGFKKSVEYKEIVEMLSVINSEIDYSTYSAAKLRRAKNAEKKRQAELKKQREREHKQFLVNVSKFLNYELDRVWNATEDYLRISKDSMFIETSQRIRIPVESARVLYKMIQAGKDIKGYDIEGYTVKSLNGHLVVGCHQINVENMHEIGQKILG